MGIESNVVTYNNLVNKLVEVDEGLELDGKDLEQPTVAYNNQMNLPCQRGKALIVLELLRKMSDSREIISPMPIPTIW